MSDGLEEWRRWENFIETTESSPDQMRYRAWRTIAIEWAKRGRCPSCSQDYEGQVFYDEDTNQLAVCTICTTADSD